MKRKKIRYYRLRLYTPIYRGQVYIHCRGYRDALRLQKKFGGKILG